MTHLTHCSTNYTIYCGACGAKSTIYTRCCGDKGHINLYLYYSFVLQHLMVDEIKCMYYIGREP